MSDAKVVNAGENTPERIAYLLFRDVMQTEGKATYKSDKAEQVDRKYILDTYAECILAVARPWERRKQ